MKVSIRSVSSSGSLTSRLCEKRIFRKVLEADYESELFFRAAINLSLDERQRFIVGAGAKRFFASAWFARWGEIRRCHRDFSHRGPASVRASSCTHCCRKPVARSITVRTRGACTPLLNCSLAPMNYLLPSLSSSP